MKPSVLESICVGETTSLRSALERLVDTGLQVLLVTDKNQRLLGILTDGDVRRALLRDVELSEPVANVVNRDFVSLRDLESSKAQRLLRTSKFNHLPILDDEGRVVDLVVADTGHVSTPRSKDIPIVITAGGRGTRLSPLTRILPKALIPVGDGTMLDKIMSNFAEQGFSAFKVIINYRRDLIKSYYAETDPPYVLDFVEERHYLGTAGGLHLLRESVNDTFIFSNCDVIAQIDYQNLLDWHKEHKAHLTVLGVQKQIDIPHGVIRIDENDFVRDIDEKPALRYLIMSGIYVIEPAVLDLVPDEKPLDMDQLIHLLRDRNLRVACYPIESGWFDMGQFEEYRELLRHFGGSDDVQA